MSDDLHFNLVGGTGTGEPRSAYSSVIENPFLRRRDQRPLFLTDADDDVEGD